MYSVSTRTIIFKQRLKSSVTNIVLAAYCLSFLVSLCITFFISLTLFDLNAFNFKNCFLMSSIVTSQTSPASSKLKNEISLRARRSV